MITIILASADLIGEYMNNAEINQMTMDTLKSLVDIRPQVIDDFSAMFEKFPHNDIVSQLLNPIVSNIIRIAPLQFDDCN